MRCFPEALGYHSGNFTLANTVGTLRDEVNELQAVLPTTPEPSGRLTLPVSSAMPLQMHAVSSHVAPIGRHG
jgi:hypothetical protein